MAEGRLEGKVALVTGAGSGIGRASAERFAAEGAEVVVVDVANAIATAQAIEAAGGSAYGIETDVAYGAAVAAMATKAIDCFGRVDVLVNNAGILDDYLPAADTPDEVWDRVLGVNLRGVFNTSRALIPQMLENGGGAIVNVASTAALVGGNGGAAYTTSKHAIVGFTRQLCFDYAKVGIRANTVCPGAVETGMTKEIFAAGDAAVMEAVRSAPIGRWAQPDELASVIVFLASDDAAFVHGATYVVDGGFSVK
ncbi:MAG TPA: glucose 1-dehydrogenase [Solirubrobacterales bacterium]|jgi:3-oxoacyl-[acyl-carrier protein] reductase|nr:glucose 1-dehydrogenase [Solirubrobacterales bacterium]